MELFIFGVLATLVTLGALTVVLHPDAVYSALALIAVLVFLAVLFVTLGAHLLAALQIIVYAGAIMVLFLFVIMLLGRSLEGGSWATHPALWVTGGIGAVGLAAATGGVLARASLSMTDTEGPEGFGGTTNLARELFTTYLLPFELTSVLLLIAVVGAVVLAKGRMQRQGTPDVTRRWPGAKDG